MREMKDSGLKSIGVIPTDWDVVRVKHVASGITDGTHGTFQRVSEGRLLLSAKNVFEDGLHISENESMISESDFLSITQNGYPKANDILLCCVGTIGRSLLYKLSEPIAFQRSVIFIRPNNSIIPAFLNYAIQCESTVTQENVMVNQSAQPGLYQGSVRELKIPYPQISEQKRIASFLDRKCAEIDALTADIETQIETLEQYKRSVITETVTKGLDPDAEMKDSGVEWIGKMPAAWSVHPVYYYFGERKNRNSLGQENNLLSLSYGNIIRKDINSIGGLLPESFNTYNIVESGDIIIRSTDLQNDKRSLRTGLVKEHGIITSAYIALKPIKPVNTDYFHYLLHAFDVMKVFYNMGNGVRQGLNFSEFAKLMVCEPPRAEQDAIVKYLDNKCAIMDNAICEKSEQLETLAEYKKSLIYEYVTGKKEVPSA